MDLKQRMEEYFNTHYELQSMNSLLKTFNINNDTKDEFFDNLYQLELDGKIIGSDLEDYMHVPECYYLQRGIVHLSAKNHYYINLPLGSKIMITDKNVKNLMEGDTVYVETKRSPKFKKQLLGHVVRVVKRPNQNIRDYLTKATLKKDKYNKQYYVELDNRPYYINSEYLNGAYPGDEVGVSVKVDNNNYIIKVVDIIKRKSQEHVFVYKNVHGEYKWVPIGTIDFEVKLDIDSSKYHDGDSILVRLDRNSVGTYIKDIENDNKIKSLVSSMAYDYSIPFDFSEETLKECESITTDIPEEEFEKRVDLRNLKTITIDGSTAKDLDDAVSIEMKGENYVLYVSIADVTHYVKLTSAIFKDVLERGTSIYPSNMVIPMLPKILSNVVCSLNPNIDHLAKTVKLEIDKTGKVIDYEVFNSIIRSDMKMSYEKVNKLLDGFEVDPAYMPHYKTLIQMAMLANILQKRRLERGYLCFESDDIEFEYDAYGKVIGIKERDKGQAQLMIENFMLLANEYMAEFAFNLDVPFIYRNHEMPEIDKISRLREELKGYSHYVAKLRNVQNPKIFQQLIIKLTENKTPDEIMMISKLMLRSMNRADYSSTSAGHYGLALENYATFTSPIRRLPDLLNHFIIGMILDGKIEKLDKYIETFAEYAYISTQTQIRAEDFEEEINNILMRSYATKFLDQILEGKIIFLLDDKVYVRTCNNIIGIIKVNKNQIQNNILSLKGDKNKIGDSIYVKIASLSEDNSEVHLEYVPKEKVMEKRKIND